MVYSNYYMCRVHNYLHYRNPFIKFNTQLLSLLEIYALYVQLMKRDVDLYGSHDIKIPPSCLLSVWTESSLKPKTRFSHAIPLRGIDSNTRKIYVHRYLDPVETSSTSGM